MRSILLFIAHGVHVVVAEFRFLFISEILLFACMKVLFHLPYNMLGFVMVLHFKICRCLCHFIRMPAKRAEFPLLEPINIRKCPASSRATDDEVHK